MSRSFKFTDAETEIIYNQMTCLQRATKRDEGWLPSFKRQVNSIVRKLEED